MDLLEYIKRVYNLEKTYYEQDLTINRLNDLLYKTNHPHLKEGAKVESVAANIGSSLLAIPMCILSGMVIGIGLIVLTLILIFIGWVLHFFTDSKFVSFLNGLNEKEYLIGVFFFGGLILGAVVGIVICIYMLVTGHSGRKRALQDRAIVHNKNEKTLEQAKIKARNINYEIEQVKKIKAQTRETLDQFYSLNIIYPKYRGLVPVAMFYQYLDSGRCTSLTGHEGAYNLYEQELMMNRISLKLDGILDRLDEIQATERQLAVAVKESNQSSIRLCNAVERCNDKLSDISVNTETSAYFNGITALNTTYLAWFKKYK